MDLITTGLVLSVVCAVLGDMISDAWDYENFFEGLLRNIVVYAFVVLAIFFFVVAAVTIGIIVAGVYLDSGVSVPSGIIS